jgi:lipopolysaccharide export system permease protein
MNKMEVRHYVEWHKKFSLAFGCFVFFFIGAPLGAIIRKGGIGMPVVASFLVFMLYHITNTIFEKNGRDMVLEPWAGVWIGTLMLIPFGIMLTLSAAHDSAFLNTEFYANIIRSLTQNRIFKYFKIKVQSGTNADMASNS